MTAPGGAYPWHLEEIGANADRDEASGSGPVAGSASPPALSMESALAAAGYGVSLIEFLAPLFAVHGSATFFGGALRIHPFHGLPEQGLPTLVDWNAERGWKQYEPAKQSPTFYFLSNSFGELMGVPITDAGEIARDRVAILMPDKRLYREAGLAWREFFQSTAARPDLGGFFAKIPQHQWAAQQLGRVPHPAQCYSYKVPSALGGVELAENLLVVSLTVHVSFSLQLLKQYQESQLPPGTPIGFVDLYDDTGKPIP